MEVEEEEEEDLIFPTTTTMLSTRELGAKLWEILPQPSVTTISSKNKNKNKHKASSSYSPPPPPSMQTSSTEFLNILNRIWSMEEQHASNLKTELDQSRARIKELTRDKQKIESVQMDDRKFMKLTQEVSELRISLSNALKNLDKEKEDRILLEDICDEFAKGIRDYENELQSLKRKTENNYQVHTDSCCHDMLILHLSEAWIDERMQMKHHHQESEKKNTIVDKLKFEIETFLKAKHERSLLKSRSSSTSSSVKESMIKSSLREKLQEARLEEAEGIHYRSRTTSRGFS